MRRALTHLALASLASLSLAGCVQPETRARAALAAPYRPVPAVAAAPESPYAGRYASLSTEPFPVPRVDAGRIPERYLRQEVAYQTSEAPGTIVIDTAARHLYYVQGEGRAIRYGVGVGKEGMSWSGTANVGAMRTWPDWYPPKEMIARRPDLREHLSQLQGGLGVAGGPGSPLGARAMYLYRDGKDSLYRIHGTEEPYTVGQAVSSGCIRMINQDAMDLFSRVTVGTRVVVLPDSAGSVPVAGTREPPAPYREAVAPASYGGRPAYEARPRYGYGNRPAYEEDAFPDEWTDGAPRG